MDFSERMDDAGRKYVLLSNECYLKWSVDRANSLHDPYDSMQLNELNDDYQLLSDPIEAFTIDFNDFQYLQNVVLSNEFNKKVDLVANIDGEASCVVGWFRWVRIKLITYNRGHNTDYNSSMTSISIPVLRVGHVGHKLSSPSIHQLK